MTFSLSSTSSLLKLPKVWLYSRLRWMQLKNYDSKPNVSILRLMSPSRFSKVIFGISFICSLNYGDLWLRDIHASRRKIFGSRFVARVFWGLRDSTLSKFSPKLQTTQSLNIVTTCFYVLHSILLDDLTTFPSAECYIFCIKDYELFQKLSLWHSILSSRRLS